MTMNKSFPVVLALTGAIIATGCGRSTDDQSIASQTPSGSSTAPPADVVNQRDQALVRVVHAVPGAAAIDVLADNAQVAAAVPYGSVTPYKEVKADADNFAIRASGQDSSAPLAENSEAITSGNHYTLIAFPGKGDERATLQVVSDNLTLPSEGKARVRVIQAAADVDAVDVKTRNADEALFDDVDFKETTSYAEVSPSEASLEVRSADGKRLLAKPVMQLEAGKSYTVVVAGRATGSPKINAMVIEDHIAPRTATN
jgi:hypothetical protein